MKNKDDWMGRTRRNDMLVSVAMNMYLGHFRCPSWWNRLLRVKGPTNEECARLSVERAKAFVAEVEKSIEQHPEESQ